MNIEPLQLDRIAFHNIAELEPAPGGGLQLQRFPRALRMQLGFKTHSRGRFWSERAAACEIRFITSGPFVRLTLGAIETEARVLVFKGDLLHSMHTISASGRTTLFLEEPAQFAQVRPDFLPRHRFAPTVWRVLFNQDALPVYHAVESFGHELRPPLAAELPRITWLAYGSSITFGGNAIHPTNSYVLHAAQRLGVDVFNKGIPGGCLCETAMADWLAAEARWDFATLELGVNLVDHATPEEFAERATALVRKIHSAHPTRRLFVLNIFPNRCDALMDASAVAAVRTPRFNEIVRELVAAIDSPNVTLIDGRTVLRNLSGLHSDLLHPADDGHLAMGEALAQHIAPFLNPTKAS